MAAAVTITAPPASPQGSGYNGAYTLAATGLANNSTAYNFVVTDPDGGTSLIPFTSNGSGASPNVLYTPGANGTMKVNVRLATPTSEANASVTVPSIN